MPCQRGFLKSTLLATILIVGLALPPPHAAGTLLATYLGGSDLEGWQYVGGIDIETADDGTVYVVGMTQSPDFPVTPGAYVCPNRGGVDFFVARLSADLSTLLAATVIGGSAEECSATICLGADGSVYISGSTKSTNFPTTLGAYDRTVGTVYDVFVARFDANLTTLMASTVLGGNGSDQSSGVLLDGGGNVLVIGFTVAGGSNTFPTTPGAFDRTISVGYTDFFVSRLDAGLTTLLASTFLGGRYNEMWPDLVLDAAGNIFVSGASESDNYPTTSGAYCETYHGAARPGQFVHDVVVSKLSADLTSLLASTYVGTDRFESSSTLCIDSDGNVHIGGHTDATDYPVTPGAYDEGHNGENEFLVTKLNNDLTAILASTFFTPDDVGFMFGSDLTCDGDGNFFMVGNGWDGLVPVTADAYDPTHNGADGVGDMFIRSMSGDLAALGYGSFLGGSGEESDATVEVLSDGTILVAGYTASTDFPVSSLGYSRAYNGGAGDAYVARLDRHPFCCASRVGDVNYDGNDEPTIGDVSTLIDAKFISGSCDPTISCFAEADVNQSGGALPDCYDITIGDISMLIDYLFITGVSLGLPNCLSNEISVEPGSAVTIDGVMQPGEWSDAATARLGVEDRVDVTVAIKHDGARLLVAFKYAFVGDGELCMPEMLIDIDNDRAVEFQADDWWFHVSGTDCEARGTYGVYTDCSVVQPDWQAVPNFPLTSNPPPLDTFEIAIPFSKLGISAGATIGLAFRVELVPTAFGYWPAEATADSPKSWGRAIIMP